MMNEEKLASTMSLLRGFISQMNDEDARKVCVFARVLVDIRAEKQEMK